MYIPRVFCGYTCLLGLRGFIKRIFNVQLMCIHVCVYLERGRKRGREKETETKREKDRQRGRSDAKVCCTVVKKANVLLKCFSKLTISIGGSRIYRKAKKAVGLGAALGQSKALGEGGGGKHILSYSSFTWHNKYWFSVDLLTFCFVFLNVDHKRGARALLAPL